MYYTDHIWNFQGKKYHENQHCKQTAGDFLSATIVIFLTLGAADFVGFVPNYIDGDNKVSLSNPPQLGNENSVLPEHITAPSINLLFQCKILRREIFPRSIRLSRMDRCDILILQNWEKKVTF